MASLIEDYEQQYAIITADITAHIAKLNVATTDLVDKREFIIKINSNIDEAKELLEQMGLEIMDSHQNVRPGLTNRLDCYQAELRRIQQEYQKSKNSPNKSITTGYESIDEFDEIGIRDESKRRLLDNSERLERTGNQLAEGYRVILETENLGNQVLQDLHHQRETIQKSRSRLRETDADLGRSSRIMNSMIMRSLQEKAVLFGVGTVFLIVVSLSIYFSISK